MIKVYDRDEAHSFYNEVEKLELLNRILDQQGIEQSPIVHMFEAFTCQIGQHAVVHCVVFEHLEVSLAELIYGEKGLSRTSYLGATGQEPVQTMEYSLSDGAEEYEYSMTMETQLRSATSHTNGQGGGLSLDLVKKIGW